MRYFLMALLPGVLAAGGCSLLQSGSQSASKAEIEELRSRVFKLEQTLEETAEARAADGVLPWHVRRPAVEGETTPPAEPIAAQAVAIRWQDLETWRTLRNGLTPDDVHAIFGEPAHVAKVRRFMSWKYDAGNPFHAKVQFDEGRLSGWVEPVANRGG